MKPSTTLKRQSTIKLVVAAAFTILTWPAAAASNGKALQDSWSWTAISNRWGPVPIAQLRQLAEGNEPSAQYFLGWSYESGPTNRQNRTEAAKWYRSAAESGFAPAQFLLGVRAEWQVDPLSNTIVGNYQVAAEWFEKAADQGHAEAMQHLGDLYYYGKLERNHNTAAKWFRLAADKGNEKAMLRLGELYLYNRGDLFQDHAESAKWFRLAAEQGDPEAQYQLALLLLDGQGIRHDPAQAREWLEQASRRGHAQATVRLASLHDDASVKLDSLPREQLEALAINGGATAALALATDYEEGRHGSIDPYRAAGLYWKILATSSPFKTDPDDTVPKAVHHLVHLYSAQIVQPLPAIPASAQITNDWPDYYADLAPKSPAQLGFRFKSTGSLVTRSEDQVAVGEMFIAGVVVPANPQEAINWFLKAAQAGDAEAMNRIGELWAAGLGGAPDFSEAVQWYRKGAKAGSARARINLGNAYRNGQGVAVDKVQAWAWLKAGSNHGAKDIESGLQEVQAQLTPEQLAKAKEIAATLP